MIEITELSNEPRQQFRIKFLGKYIDFQFYYEPNQMGWFMTFTYLEYTSGWIRLTSCPNLIREVKDTLGIGILCKTNDGIDPLFLDDFSIDRAKLYILAPEEVQNIESELYVKV